MPLYEYFCNDCKETFVLLRPIDQMDHPAQCSRGHTSSRRLLSVVARVSKAGDAVDQFTAGCGCGASCSCAN